MFRSLALLAFAATASARRPSYPSCATGMTCFQLTPYQNRPDLVYDCAAINASTQPAKGDVYLMHGNDGPRSKAMWALMMTHFAGQGYNNLACDQRGFSPGASPNIATEYNYDLIAADIFAVADSYYGVGSKIHVVAHDQGGRVGWHALRPAGKGRTRYASYSALAEAHSDAFSDALYGKNTNAQQQTAFMYLWDFLLPDPAYVYNGANFHHVCQKYYDYQTQLACQTALWWYSGAVASGNLAVQPFGGFGSVGQMIGIPDSYIRANPPVPLEGVPQATRVGFVPKVPVLYMCGAGELVDKCNNHFRDASAKLVENFSYARIASCSHDLTSTKECPAYQQVIDIIMKHIQASTPEIVVVSGDDD